jgi:hypothetical protein
MSAFIKLNKQDAFVVPYTAHKSFFIPSTDISAGEGLDFFYGTKNTLDLFHLSEPLANQEYERLIYSSVNHLYYSNYSGSIESGSFENYNQSTLYFNKGIEQAEGSHIFVFSLKRERVGEAINPGTFNFYSGSTFAIIDDAEGNLVIQGNTFIENLYSSSTVTHLVSERLTITGIDSGNATISFADSTLYGLDTNYSLVSAEFLGDLQDSPFILDNSISSLTVSDPYTDELSFLDNNTLQSADTLILGFLDTGAIGEAIEFTYVSSSIDLTLLASTGSFSAGDIVGNIYYPHGIAVVTNSALATHLWYGEQYSSSFAWENTHTVFQHEYKCKVNESSLNYSQNPSIKSGSNGDVYDFATGSYFQPYITTIGLYNDTNELVAVGKLAQPVPKSRYTDMTFVVKFDS